MNYETFGQDTIAVTGEITPEIKSWAEKIVKLKGNAQNMLNAAINYVKAFNRSLQKHIDAGQKYFESKDAEYIQSTAAKSSALQNAMIDSFGGDVNLAEKYPTKWAELKAANKKMGELLSKMSGWNVAVGDAELKRLQEQHKALQRGDLDNPVVDETVKIRFINQAYAAEGKHYDDQVKEKVREKYEKSGHKKAKTVSKTVSKTVLPPIEPAVHPATLPDVEPPLYSQSRIPSQNIPYVEPSTKKETPWGVIAGVAAGAVALFALNR